MKLDMQRERVAGFKQFIEDVREARFPEPQHVVRAPDNLIQEFVSAIEQE